MSRQLRLIVALALPVICLVAYAGWHGWIAVQGQKVTLPIRGFDPRDLLSGHYLIYQVDYGLKSLCAKTSQPETGPFYLCLSSKKIHDGRPPSTSCRQYLRGRCERGRFRTGIERFYVPQKHARKLEKAVQNRKGSVTLSLDGKGGAVVIELLIEGRSWKQWVAAEK
ncbi:MAG: hypothetical protein CMM48_00705 [Rhodospirillaceae bacterium]|nr:hypothetical protein [Rhodospirillaceae bacterium]HAA91813.1 hypothetical protein [Rhodospirillaceae bacterium]|tara:strand:+ start:179 stop:679 length:501 start_codon:yes stop_codon:yes gene_type:complete